MKSKKGFKMIWVVGLALAVAFSFSSVKLMAAPLSRSGCAENRNGLTYGNLL